jgi:hypothetical protein
LPTTERTATGRLRRSERRSSFSAAGLGVAAQSLVPAGGGLSPGEKTGEKLCERPACCGEVATLYLSRIELMFCSV